MHRDSDVLEEKLDADCFGFMVCFLLVYYMFPRCFVVPAHVKMGDCCLGWLLPVAEHSSQTILFVFLLFLFPGWVAPSPGCGPFLFF